eukprot:gnl/MRDRNA2_/MRDRNA2_311022_c0_seq1.p1 gnl/MRDRNA2_/MRDRNA2_311022_c0~~gnl/MRDRNA2_/MRDRNA2_311022_c0_seq1.p1  ORF type:complete len:271 (+),score=34.18 gnl/MRDRNA2_/MRDRNA2_311022_c0_seq1:95-814(+)
MEPLFGRDSVIHCPPQLASKGVTVISGHHGRVMFRSHRIVLDSCSGTEGHPLQGLILPEGILVTHDGTVESRKLTTVFGVSRGLQCRDANKAVVASKKAGAKDLKSMQSISIAGDGSARQSSENYHSPVHCLPKGDDAIECEENLSPTYSSSRRSAMIDEEPQEVEGPQSPTEADETQPHSSATPAAQEQRRRRKPSDDDLQDVLWKKKELPMMSRTMDINELPYLLNELQPPRDAARL